MTRFHPFSIVFHSEHLIKQVPNASSRAADLRDLGEKSSRRLNVVCVFKKASARVDVLHEVMLEVVYLVTVVNEFDVRT